MSKKTYSELSDNEVRVAVRVSLNISKSEEEVKQRVKDELNYPYESFPITSTSSGPMIMFMVMLWGPTGNSLSI